MTQQSDLEEAHYSREGDNSNHPDDNSSDDNIDEFVFGDADIAAEGGDAHAEEAEAVPDNNMPLTKRTKRPIFFSYPKNIDKGVTSCKLFSSSHEWIKREVKNGRFASESDAMRKLTWEAIKYRGATDGSRDQALYVVRQAQERVVMNAQKRLSKYVYEQNETVKETRDEMLSEIRNLRDALERIDENQVATAKRLEMIDEHLKMIRRIIMRVSETASVSFAVLRHFVMGIMVFRFPLGTNSQESFNYYNKTFTEKLREWARAARRGDFLQDPELQSKKIADFLSDATGYVQPQTAQELEQGKSRYPPLEPVDRSGTT